MAYGITLARLAGALTLVPATSVVVAERRTLSVLELMSSAQIQLKRIHDNLRHGILGISQAASRGYYTFCGRNHLLHSHILA
jgi:hypothetical protein